MSVNILMSHVGNSYNYGTAMMAINLMSQIYKINTKVKFFLDVKDSQSMDRYLESTDLKNIYPMEETMESIYSTKVYNLFALKKQIGLYKNSIIKKYDAIIVLGGDDLSHCYGTGALLKELFILESLSKDIKILLVGQTIGPFNKVFEKISREKLKGTHIFTRDRLSFAYLKRIGFTNVEESRDLALLDLPKENNELLVIDRYGLKQGEYITVVPSGLVSSYCKDYDIYVENIYKMIQQLLSYKRLKQKRVVLLPHVLLPAHVDDRKIIKFLEESLSVDMKRRVLFIYDELLPHEAREILGNGVLTITGRMHAAVSTFMLRKPAISLSYSYKYDGVIGEGLNLTRLIIDAASEQKWMSRQIVKDVMAKVEFILNNYDSLVETIDKNIKDCSDMVLEDIYKVNKILT